MPVRAAGYRTALVAPRGYLAGLADAAIWGARIALEEIAAWFEGDPAPAAAWRRAILLAAASKAARARVADDRRDGRFDAVVGPLKAACRQVVLDRYPELRPTVQAGRDREYHLGAQGLPAGVRLKHAVFRGEVSLILERRWAEAQGARLAALAPPGSWLVPKGGELHLREAVDVLDPGQPLAAQEATVTAALDEVVRLAGIGRVVAAPGA